MQTVHMGHTTKSGKQVSVDSPFCFPSFKTNNNSDNKVANIWLHKMHWPIDQISQLGIPKQNKPKEHY